MPTRSRKSPVKKKAAKRTTPIKKKAATVRKKSAQKPVKKAARKTATSKRKTTTKEATTRSVAKKSTTRKTVATKTRTTTRKAGTGKIAPTKKKTASVVKRKSPREEKAIRQQLLTQPHSVEADSQLPPVEEKSPAIASTPIPAPAMDKKSWQQAAQQHYDNHHIRLSSKKGGIKPSGKKPLW